MTTPIIADELVAAGRAAHTTFEDIPAEPVTVADAANVSSAEGSDIMRRYTAHGFSILRLMSAPVDGDTLRSLAESLCLGDSFVPPLYTTGGAEAAKISRISATRNAGTGYANHPSFGRTVGQALHCDGTLQDIGYVKASMLLCETAASSGGDTILFNSCGAFASLTQFDLPAAVALATPGTLVRRATINGSSDVNAGPAFAVRDGALVGRYCVTDTDSWAAPDGVSADDLHRGIEFLARASRPGSPHFLQLRLDSGEVIVFDNTRISHGRTEYVDTVTQHRCMYRGLYLRHPLVRGLADHARA